MKRRLCHTKDKSQACKAPYVYRSHWIRTHMFYTYVYMYICGGNWCALARTKPRKKKQVAKQFFLDFFTINIKRKEEVANSIFEMGFTCQKPRC